MKIMKAQLKQIIKEELAAVVETKQLERGPTFDIQDAIQMLETEEDTTGTLHHVINRLYAALDKLGGGDGEEELEEVKKKSPDDIVARYPDPEGKNPDQVIYRWQQDEFDQHQAAWKDFMKRTGDKKEIEEGGPAGHYTGGGKSAASQLSGIGFEIDDLINKTTRLLIDTEMDSTMKSIAIDIADHIRDDVKKRYRQLAYYVQGATKELDESNLFQNIRAKRARGEAPAKPGDEDYPDEKSWKKATMDEAEKVDKDAMACNKPKRTPKHPKKSHVVKACEDGKEKIIRFGEQGAKTAGAPKKGESERMKKKRKSFKARHGKNIKKGKMSAAYWADKVKW